MKTAIGSVLTAAGASICCIGPVVFSALGVGALGAAATRFEPYRPVFLTLTAALLAGSFYIVYRPSGDACAADETCQPAPKRTAKIVLWLATLLVILLITFPYYVNWLV